MNCFFAEALDLREHPIRKVGKKLRTEYLSALSYFIDKTVVEALECPEEQKGLIAERLILYKSMLPADIVITDTNKNSGISSLATFTKPWRRKYRYMLVCDAALILFDRNLTLFSMEILKKNLPLKHTDYVDRLCSLLFGTQKIESKYSVVAPLINQFRANSTFFQKKERRIIVTANMSAGKSTLINAIVGKPVTRTSQEACTGNVCYILSKPYEDEKIHLQTQNLTLNASTTDLRNYCWEKRIAIASYFTGYAANVPRTRIIDTPGVDASLNREHGKCARDALLNEKYDLVLYIVSPTRLGTNAEKKHLLWVAQNLQKEKVIFVINKLDDYNPSCDSIEESIRQFREDLLKTGFMDPIICPISAYFSYLIKLKMGGRTLSYDEEDQYALYSKKFARDFYDLSRYYEGAQCSSYDSVEVMLSKRSGMYGLEKIIYGGGL